MYSDGGMVFGGGFMWLFWILVIVAIVWLITSAVNSGVRNRRDADDSPLEILKRRYARGEIDEEEFGRRRRELEG